RPIRQDPLDGKRARRMPGHVTCGIRRKATGPRRAPSSSHGTAGRDHCTVQLSVKVTEPALGRVGTVAPAPCSAATRAAPVCAGQAAPPAALQVAGAQVRLVGTGSVTTAPSAASGPLLVTVIA